MTFQSPVANILIEENILDWHLCQICGRLNVELNEDFFMIIILLGNTIFIILVRSVLICNPTEKFYHLIFEEKNGLKS